MRDSQKTQALFDKAVEDMDQALSTGGVVDKYLMEIALKAFLGHIKIKNYEVREDALKFVVNKHLTENIEELKKILPKTLPGYCR